VRSSSDRWCLAIAGVSLDAPAGALIACGDRVLDRTIVRIDGGPGVRRLDAFRTASESVPSSRAEQMVRKRSDVCNEHRSVDEGASRNDGSRVGSE
jgi:hypothetical protein